MPQMAPINWLMLFFVFTMIFLMFSMTNYYTFLPPTKNIEYKSTSTSSTLIWKW